MTTTFTVQPFADADQDVSADELDAILTTLENDPGVHAPAMSYDSEHRRVGAIFQVDFTTERDATIDTATRIAVTAFELALASARLDAEAVGVS
ncbi:MAG TPA: hypothetical protein VH063_00055, partial [Gaiellaceae bacterium]|nr:hypothetical protein [Gaiellaceae bacterium]